MARREIHAEALKIKLATDAGERLKLMQWVGIKWTEAKLSHFYNTLKKAQDAVVFATREVLEFETRKLNSDIENDLRNAVTLESTALQTLDQMVRADDAVKIANPIP